MRTKISRNKASRECHYITLFLPLGRFEVILIKVGEYYTILSMFQLLDKILVQIIFNLEKQK